VKTNRSNWGLLASGFTLLEMLTVIAIIGLMAALIGPNLGNFKPNVVASATQQLLTDVSRARLLATSQHTTVYMVFVPPSFWNDPVFQAGFNTSTDYANAYPLLDKQLTGYNFVSLRSIGDQPGRHTPHYLSSWKTMPDGTYIHPTKYNNFYTNYAYYDLYTNNITAPGVNVFATYAPFSNTVSVPFPTELTPAVNSQYTTLPCIAFNYLGQLVNPVTGNLAAGDELIPIAKGSVMYKRDPVTRTNMPPGVPNVLESPPGASLTNSFSVVQIERLTGRARVVRQEVK